MKVVWHIVRKDLRRLRVPLALFSLLVAGKIAFYAFITGLVSIPDVEWLRRMQNGPEMLLRFLVEPVFAYVLVGWLVFEDSPVEQDAHWITRPISGGQLFAAKLLGSGLMFVVWPLVLNVAWWLWCGVGVAEVLRSAADFAGMNLALVVLGLACATITGGFPRYVLWSLVGVVVLNMLQLAFTIIGDSGSGLDRMLVSLGVAAVFGILIAGHQFVTRRRSKSMVFVGVGLLAMTAVGSAWRGNPQRVSSRPAAPELAAQLKMQLTGPARYRDIGHQHYVTLPIRVDGVPDNSALAGVRVRGNWSFDGVEAWTSQLGTSWPSLWKEAIRRQLSPVVPAEPDGQFTINLPFSRPMAQRAAREPVALHAEVDIELCRGEILAELPVREIQVEEYAVAFVSNGSMPKKPRADDATAKPVQHAVSLLLTEKSAWGLQENSNMRTIATHYALLNQRTGEFLLPDGPRSGPEAVTILNQTKVICWRLTYLAGAEPIRLDEIKLVVLRFDRRETVHLDLRINPVAFAADSVHTSVERASEPVGAAGGDAAANQ